MSTPKIAQPRQNANTDSSVAATTIRPSSTYAAPELPNPKYATTAATEMVAPMPWANRFGGPGTYFAGNDSRGVITLVTSCPSGLSVGPVSTRATNPYASGMSNQN